MNLGDVMFFLSILVIFLLACAVVYTLWTAAGLVATGLFEQKVLTIGLVVMLVLLTPGGGGG